jgi:PAS domain S-box-containing protein
MAEQTTAEIQRLKSCINDLIGIVALPAIWSGSNPTGILRTLADMLVSMIQLDFVCLRLKHSAGDLPLEVVRHRNSDPVPNLPPEIGELLQSWSSSDFQQGPRLVRKVPEGQDLSIFPMPLGLAGEIGILVAGSRRADFPLPTERLLLNVAANQASVWLQGAHLLNEQKRVSEELDQNVALRAEELAAANKELRDRERRIRRLIDSNIIGIVIWDLDGRLLDANDAFLRMVGYEREDLQAGLGWFEITPPEWQQEHARYEAEELKATGMMQVREKEYFRKDGSRVPVLIGAACFEDEPNQGVAYILDLSKQKRAEEALRRSEAYLADAQSLTHTGSCAIDATNRETVYWSDEMFRIFGFDPQQGPPIWDCFLERIHPEDRDMVTSANDRTFRTKVNCDVEFRIVQPDGKIKHIHAIGHPVLNLAGELVQVLGTMVDITERKRADEERERLREAHRVVVETANDVVVSADENGAIQFANPTTRRVFGYEPGELIGKPLTVLMPEFIRKLHEEGFKRYLATGRRHVNWQGTELTGLRKDGQEFPVEVSFGELTMKGSRVFTGFIRDITERKQAERERERLHRVQSDLAHMTRVNTLGELTASLAHEIRQPIAAAMTDAQTSMRWLARDVPDLGEAREAVSRMIKDIVRASDIINRIRTHFQKGSPQRERLAVNDVVREMIALLNTEMAEHTSTVYSELGEDLPFVSAIRVEVQQVLMNLILNGIESMKELESPGTLRIVTQLSDEDFVQVSITDTGKGIKPEDGEHIFQAFFTTKREGTGMGLAISRSIIESHGGRLWFTPNADVGVAFHFTLPIDASIGQ